MKRLPNVGEILKIQCGPLNGRECEIIKVKNVNRILVRVDSINIYITAVLPSSYLANSVS